MNPLVPYPLPPVIPPSERPTSGAFDESQLRATTHLQEHGQISDAIPGGLVEMLAERGRYEEAILDQIKEAYDREDSTAVMTFVGRLLYAGPGITQKDDLA
jgi:hypothetical protein